MGDPPTIQNPPPNLQTQIVRPEVRPQVATLAHDATPQTLLRVRPEVLRDQFNYQNLNGVVRSMRSLVTLHADRLSELTAMREQAGQGPARPTHEGATHLIREGRMIIADAERLAGALRTERSGETAPSREAPPTGRGGMAGVLKGGKGGEELTLFEKVFLARFGEAVILGEKLEKGQFRFLVKTEKAWGEFFQRFLAFTEQKTAKTAEVESLVYRGLLNSSLISDLKFLSGRIEKFARLQIQSSQVLQKLASLVPGDVVAQAMLASFLGGPEFAYLALSHRIVNPEAAREGEGTLVEAYKSPEQMKGEAIREGVRDVRQGIALSARTEQLIAKQLDLDVRPARLDVTSDRKTGPAPVGEGTKEGFAASGIFGKRRKKGGLFGGLFEQGGETGSGFVPWYQLLFRPKKITGKVRWWVPLLYVAATSAAVFFAFYVFRYLMQR